MFYLQHLSVTTYQKSIRLNMHKTSQHLQVIVTRVWDMTNFTNFKSEILIEHI